MPQAALVSSPGVETFWRLAQCAMQLRISNRWGYGGCHCIGDLILHCEDVGEIAVVALGSVVISRFGLDQLRCYADAVPGFAETAFEHIAHAELASHLLHIDDAALVSK